MKALSFRLIISALALTVAFSSCKKDEKDNPTDPNAVTGNFTIGNKTYKFKGAFAQKYGSDPANYEGFNIDLILYSDGVTFAPSGGVIGAVPDSVSGAGAVLYFENYTSNKDKIIDGTYNYSTTLPGPLFTFSGDSFGTEGDYTLGILNNRIFNGGSYTISTEADGRRTVSFNLNVIGGDKITGQFSGPLAYFY